MKYKILNIVYPKIGGCQYYRQIHPYEAFSAFPEFKIDCKRDVMFLPIENLSGYHLAVFHKNYVNVKILNMLRNLNIKTMVDFDDYWNLPTNHVSYAHYKRTKQTEKFIEIIKQADYISTTTKLLAKSIIPLNKKVFIFPNILSVSDSYIYPAEIKNDRLRFGYIGGSCHLPDIEMLRELNNKLSHSGLSYSLSLFGYKHDSVYFDYAKVLTDNARHTKNLSLFPSLPVPEYLVYYNMIDVSLIPLRDNRFSSMKSELKLVEAGVFKKSVIVSDVWPYKPLLKDKINCLVAGSRTDWFKKMKYLIKNPNHLTDLGCQLNQDIQKHFNYEQISKYRAEVYKEIIQKG